jgi:hypothetical protein
MMPSCWSQCRLTPPSSRTSQFPKSRSKCEIHDYKGKRPLKPKTKKKQRWWVIYVLSIDNRRLQNKREKMVVKVGLAESQLSATKLGEVMRKIGRPVSGEVKYRRIERSVIILILQRRQRLISRSLEGAWSKRTYDTRFATRVLRQRRLRSSCDDAVCVSVCFLLVSWGLRWFWGFALWRGEDSVKDCREGVHCVWMCREKTRL